MLELEQEPEPKGRRFVEKCRRCDGYIVVHFYENDEDSGYAAWPKQPCDNPKCCEKIGGDQIWPPPLPCAKMGPKMEGKVDKSIVERARDFATKAHEGQKQKYTGFPYITHPEAVVAILIGAGINDETTLAAAWLHDVCEDCGVSTLEIDEEFSPEVGELVFYLTDCGPGLGNRSARKALDRSRLSRAPSAAQTIKVADMIDNTSSIVERDPHFAVTYMREKALLLPLMTKAHLGMLARAKATVEAYEQAQVQSWLEGRPHA